MGIEQILKKNICKQIFYTDSCRAIINNGVCETHNVAFVRRMMLIINQSNSGVC